ncbi:Nif11-like leader peptide family natural product precursor [Clostridioides difficile]
MNEKLIKILDEAKRDSAFKKEIMETRKQRDVMDSFCKVVTSRGYDITIGELFSIGEEYTSNLLKSVNGGAAYPIEDWSDWFEDFFIMLANI